MMLLSPADVISTYQEFLKHHPQYRDKIDLSKSKSLYSQYPPKYEILKTKFNFNVLFIGESCPKMMEYYFFNPKSSLKNGFSQNMLQLCEIPKLGPKGLKMFFKKGFYLTDAVKGIYYKSKSENSIHHRILTFNFKHFLSQELQTFTGEILVMLGNSALNIIKLWPPYLEAFPQDQKTSITKLSGKIRQIPPYKFLFSPFPSGYAMNRYNKEIKTTFQQLMDLI